MILDSYITASLIIEGVLDSDQIFESETDLDNWIETLRDEYKLIGATGQWDIYALTHDHPPYDGECACIQYVSDHSSRDTIGPMTVLQSSDQ